MEATDLCLLGLALVGLGCLATILSVKVIPLWIRLLGQEHGRYAGLCMSEPADNGGTKRKVGGRGQAETESPHLALSLPSVP